MNDENEKIEPGKKPVRKKKRGPKFQHSSRKGGRRKADGRPMDESLAMMYKGWRSFTKARRRERVYIAGKVSGLPGYQVVFRAAEMGLYRRGWRYGNVVNPAKECPQGWGWWRCMARCLRLLLGCDAIALLPNWKESKGARIEYAVARIAGKRVYDLKKKGV